jgi:hypothetical protein
VLSPSLHDALDFRNNAAQNRVDGNASALRGNEPERAEIGRLTPFPKRMPHPWFCPAHNTIAAAGLNDLEYLTLRKRGIEPLILADARGREGVKRIFGVDEYPRTVASLLPLFPASGECRNGHARAVGLRGTDPDRQLRPKQNLYV